MQQDPHIPDAELIMAIDGELEEKRCGEVNRHLSHCWECRSRRVEFERAIEDYMAVHRTMMEELGSSPAAGPAARLRAALSVEDAGPGPAARWPAPLRMPRAFVAAAGLALVLPLSILVWISGQRLDAAGPLPDARLTPGAVRFISKQQVCEVPAEDEGRMVPADLARRVFQQYGISHPLPRTYEVDYLISPALGGTTAVQNLWPVPYADGVWTSRVKDALEDHLRTLVCEGKLDLATAQREIATDWIAAYKRYFRTTSPVASHARFVKDSPWE